MQPDQLKLDLEQDARRWRQGIMLEDSPSVPCGFLLLEVKPRDAFGRFSKHWHETGRTVCVQTDWDFPSIARAFGWTMPKGKGGCEHGGTDGTIPCPSCGMKVDRMIRSARRFLDLIAADAWVAPDPGYFMGDE